MHLFAALLALCCQDPAALPPSTTRAVDVIELKNGDQLQGRITAETDGYVEIELEVGATVGFSTAEVRAVRRGVAITVVASAKVTAQKEWFVLHDACGNAVGWLNTAVVHREDGGFTVNEEYEFQNGSRRYQVTTLAVADAAGLAVSTYFRERITEPILAVLRLPIADVGGQHERVVDERIVEATRVDNHLVVQRLDRTGRKERQLPWSSGASFPLLARAMARATPAAGVATSMFDPASEEMVVRQYDGNRLRSVVLDGKTVQVTEVAETSTTGRNSEWIDAGMRTVRRELAGPALVAVPSNAESARLAVGATSIPGSIMPEAGGTFGLWVPNPAWLAQEGLPAGQVALSCEVHGASVSLSRLDHLEPTTPLDVAADAVSNWFRLLQPELVIHAREAVTVRERAAVQLRAAGKRAGVPWQATVEVIPHHGQFLVLVLVAPSRAWDELASDFVFLRRSIELDAQALAPKLQGPLMGRARGEPRSYQPMDRVPKEGKQPVAVPPVSTPSPPTGDGRGVVRIPNDG